MTKKKQLDNVAINTDFDAFCKKHKLDSAILVIEDGKEKISKDEVKVNLLVGVHSKNKKHEEALMEPTRKLFSCVGLNVNALTIAAKFMKEEEKRQDLAIRISNLSKKDKKRLAEIQDEKFTLVEKKEYEKASQLRHEELELLGYEPEPINSVDDGVLTHQLLPEEISVMTQKLIDSMKGWGLNK